MTGSRFAIAAGAEWRTLLACLPLGATTSRILAQHIIPTALPAVTVQATLGMGGAILAEAALSYLGLGTQPPQPSWGRMLSEAQTLLFQAPRLARAR